VADRGRGTFIRPFRPQVSASRLYLHRLHGGGERTGLSVQLRQPNGTVYNKKTNDKKPASTAYRLTELQRLRDVGQFLTSSLEPQHRAFAVTTSAGVSVCVQTRLGDKGSIRDDRNRWMAQCQLFLRLADKFEIRIEAGGWDQLHGFRRSYCVGDGFIRRWYGRYWSVL